MHDTLSLRRAANRLHNVLQRVAVGMRLPLPAGGSGSGDVPPAVAAAIPDQVAVHAMHTLFNTEIALGSVDCGTSAEQFCRDFRGKMLRTR